LNVLLLEDFNCSQIDDVPEAEDYFVGLWSYPQIDNALVINRFLRKKPFFFGYYPLIEKLKLKERRILENEILTGIETYVNFYHDFAHILLSDCDMHLRKYEGQVYPLFTSYGCPNGCAFCPVGVNCNRKRIELPVWNVKKVLDICEKQGYKNIHFTDEDFFFDSSRALDILQYTQGKGFNYIALGSVRTVTKFIERYGVDILNQCGMRLIEVGLESADPELNKKMGKPGLDKYSFLAEQTKGKVDIFWLTMTFFPGETIGSLRATGSFLEQYGFAIHELYGRVQTNSTIGGLGQFFQPYVGAAGADRLEEKGIILSERPIRLLPSFVPFSFLYSKIKKARPIRTYEEKWFDLYGIDKSLLTYELHPELGQEKEISIKDIYLDLIEYFTKEDVVTYLAILARLGVIE
jgi:radical SAM superfamily enzyme YgiQ (UPF0313 family)